MTNPNSAVPGVIEQLAALSAGDDAAIDLAAAALALACLFHPAVPADRYRRHFEKIAADVAARHAALREAGAPDSAETRLAALKHILADKYGYAADEDSPRHIQNADIMRVIDRGRGGPVALGLLYIVAAAAQGWPAYGVDLPGHFAVRLDKDGSRLIFDPHEGCRILQAADLRRIVKRHGGPQAELSARHYDAISRRAVLIRLQNHVKLRQIEAEDYEGALASVEAMRAIEPGEYRLLLDAGVLYARTGRKRQAIDAIEAYIAHAPDRRDRQQAAILLSDIRAMPDQS